MSSSDGIDVANYVVDSEPSNFLKCSMSRRVKVGAVSEDKLRPYLVEQFQTHVGNTTDPIKSIHYGNTSRRVVLIELHNSEEAASIKAAVDNVPCPLIGSRPLYVEYAIPRKQKEELDVLRRVNDVSRQVAVSDPSSRIPGLILIPEFITEGEEKELLAFFDQDEGARWLQTIRARQVQHYGYEFNYDTRRCDTDRPLDSNLPAPLHQLNERIPLSPPYVAKSTDSTSTRPDQITVNDYQPGQGIASHMDTHSAFTEAIASLSLASEIVMEFRHPFDPDAVESVILQPRSLLIMTGASRYQWSHAIPSRNFDVIDGCRVPRQRRISITFRKVQSSPCTCPFPDQCDRGAQNGHNLSTNGSDEQEELSLAPTTVEKDFVHAFYDTVAHHFDSTRYNQWPRVAEFLQSLEAPSFVADIGCGNGKYMKGDAAKKHVMIGGDRSMKLVNICHSHGLDVMTLDALVVPIRSNSCDAALSIAVLHHLSTYHHRLAAVKEIVRVLKVGGKGLIYAWAHEQQRNSRRQFEENRQDYMVPWNLDKRFTSKKTEEEDAKKATVVQRFCHMYKEGEVASLVAATGNAEVVEQYYDNSNWAVILRRTR